MFTGLKLYALLGIGLVIVALSGSVAFLWQVHKADIASLALKQSKIKELADDLGDAVKEANDIRARMKLLDSLVATERLRQQQLQKDRDATKEELDAIKASLPKADQECLDRPLPDALLDRLRDGPARGDKDPPGADPRKPPAAVPNPTVGGEHLSGAD